jgi:hypothetical protein
MGLPASRLSRLFPGQIVLGVYGVYGVYGKCGPQDSNLQPRDSRALAFPRGLDYLILRWSGLPPA